MKIENLKELQKVIQACRKLGVQSIKIDNVEFHLGSLPSVRKTTDYSADFPEASIKIPKFTGEISAIDPIATEELTPEQLMMWSAKSDTGEVSEGQQ